MPGGPGTCTQGLQDAGDACGGALGGCDGTIGLTCSGAPGSKSCVAIPYVAGGSPCGTIDGGPFTSCTAGDCYADGGLALAGVTGACQAAAADGQACDIVAGPPCLTPARCVVTGGATSGICTIPSGATCG